MSHYGRLLDAYDTAWNAAEGEGVPPSEVEAAALQAVYNLGHADAREATA